MAAATHSPSLRVPSRCGTFSSTRELSARTPTPVLRDLVGPLQRFSARPTASSSARPQRLPHLPRKFLQPAGTLVRPPDRLAHMQYDQCHHLRAKYTRHALPTRLMHCSNGRHTAFAPTRIMSVPSHRLAVRAAHAHAWRETVSCCRQAIAEASRPSGSTHMLTGAPATHA
eukprot:5682914-Prymnesium_polylepis.4